MDARLKIFNTVLCFAVLAALTLAAPVSAKRTAEPAVGDDKQRYIILLEDPPLAAYDGRIMHTPEREMDLTRFQATANHVTGAKKLDTSSPGSKKYLRFLDERFESVRGESVLRLGRQLTATHRYRNALNGFATELSEAEVRALRNVPGVKSVLPDIIQKLQTDSGPNWIGADKIYNGSAGPFPASGGEGIVVGLIDSGINWDHNSFVDPGEGSAPGWDHVNPFVFQKGLCSQTDVLCNDKLVGVYDFVEDDSATDAIEENTDGKDNSGHGSHVASIAVGNPLNVTLNGLPTVIAGVAPNANIVSYRVCFIGDATDPEDDGCQTSAIFSAIEQAITDKVDVVNYSIGTDTNDPWGNGTTTLAFLNLRAAGIFVATSAGNAGPNAGTIGSPANAPWITAVGNATHDRVFASALESLSGGDTPPPNSLIGATFTDGIGVRSIVHASDFGYPLCGVGESEPGASEPAVCSDYTGASNPFPENTFDGEIVVCDRGTYGRVEKGKNLMLAGAGGYVLANTESWGEVVWADDHCLPATHLGLKDSDTLRAWLGSGSNHRGGLSGFSIFHIAEAGDQIHISSSRGPGLPPIQDTLKPDLIAPGTEILGASSVDNNFAFLTGTSMASPHVTGGAALLKSIHPDWTPSVISSALMMTATPELAIDFNGSEATAFKRGAGRPRLDQAVNAGLYLDETESDFLAADPDRGGNPRDLNLPGLVDSTCRISCAFQRTVTDLAGGASWSATTTGFASGVSVSVSPASFTLANNASRALTINIDLSQSELVGAWVYGEVRLSSNGLPDAVFPVAVFADGGELPFEWRIDSDDISGWQDFELSGLSAMPDATFTSGGLVVPTETVELLPQDPTDNDPYDGGEGVMTVMHTVPADTLWLHTATLPSTSADLDLFVGLDVNGDGRAQESEELCASTSPTEIELCDLFSPVAGEYWVLVQNWEATLPQDAATLKSAVVSHDTAMLLTASGSGIVATGASQKVRVSWDDVGAVPGTELIGAVGIGTRRETPNNIGIVPVVFSKPGIAEPETLVLMDGVDRGLTVESGGTHDRIYFDIPPGTASFTISTTVTSDVVGQNAALALELYRVDFDDAFTNAPFVAAPDTSGAPLASASGSVNAGPTLTSTGNNAVPGRWFAVLKNSSSDPASIEIRADMSFSGESIPLRAGLWQPTSRPDLSQGFDYASTGDYRAFLWYTYDENGEPAWYLAAGINPVGNVWVAQLKRYTNDGTLQQSTPVGYVSVTTLAEQDNVFSFVLFGEEGSDRMEPLSPPICPSVNNVQKSYTGIWSREAVGIGGTSVLTNGTSQGYLHYIYDAKGKPVWLLSAGVAAGLPHAEVSLMQFSGYCAVCTGSTPTSLEVGVFELDYSDEDSANWNFNYILNSPLSGTVNRTDDVDKLTTPIACE
ncbi:MAG: S8 family serine peptidase [Xanthomonadales bacterium]|nr:S8 family serine peptidase [Xanthomonadales bacterium]